MSRESGASNTGLPACAGNDERESQFLLELRLVLLAEGRDALLVVFGLAPLLVGVAFGLEAEPDAGIVSGGEHALDGLEGERRHRDEVGHNVRGLPGAR